MYSTEQFTHSLVTAWMRHGDQDVVQGLAETALSRASSALPANLLEELGAELRPEVVQIKGLSWVKPAATTGVFGFGKASFEITRFINSTGLAERDEFFIAQINPWWDFDNPAESPYSAQETLSADPERNRTLIQNFLTKRSA